NICPVLLVDISTDRLRRCYSNTYTINYCNQGTQNATNAYLQVFLPEIIAILDASQTYTTNNGYYTFALGDVLVGECNTIMVTDSVACDTPLGTAVCAEAYIFPNPSCYDPSPLWDGSNLESDATCLGNSIQFIITNNGSAMNDSTEYRIYEDDLVNVFSKIKLEAGEQKEIMVAANNATYRLVANQTPNNPNSTYTQTVIENCNNNNSLGFVISQSENDLQPNYENDCHEVVGAYDPNDKMAVPRGMSEEHLLPPNEGITYTIRFQNTGSDTAYRVMLVDTLALEWLDVASLHISAASHAYQVRIENGKTLIVTFNNIMLPDSSTNVAGSQGYISFKVLQKVDNPMRTRIANFADIYFDYNDAVRTPTIFHTIGQALINHSPTTESPNNNTHIYSLNPNPINNILSISIDALPTDADIALVNLCGTIVLQQNLQTQHSLVSTQQLPNGMYIYRITNAKQQVIQTGKLIIIH
ncbi:MAG: T9SS type A sorting domain-containing protein, partial [Chitinophagales bacterium]|nr:T9SS type A sorting domain-containing protein [Chitinophagales bacterium]